MDVSKIMMAHIATEVIVIGGISFLFNKRISELKTKVAELEKKLGELEKREGCSSSPEGGITDEQFGQFQQQTTQHINNIYSAIRQIANTVNGGGVGATTSSPTPNNHTHTRTQNGRTPHPQHTVPLKQYPRHHPLHPQNQQQTLLSNLSLSPENTNGNGNSPRAKLEVIDEKEKKEIPIEELDDELEDELKDLSDGQGDESRVDESSGPVSRGDEETGIKEDDNDISCHQETPLEFIPTKGKKLVKKRNLNK